MSSSAAAAAAPSLVNGVCAVVAWQCVWIPTWPWPMQFSYRPRHSLWWIWGRTHSDPKWAAYYCGRRHLARHQRPRTRAGLPCPRLEPVTDNDPAANDWFARTQFIHRKTKRNIKNYSETENVKIIVVVNRNGRPSLLVGLLCFWCFGVRSGSVSFSLWYQSVGREVKSQLE